ncbi:hypothetical protein [Leptospira sp. GIMC2001]|uniref:hypothetical protein n=1 Tax=Leptospira sp. GIMC2001 TaxID=1513297 RepID=UPI00234A4AFD|nr:hypothetical protein [Leptospira sp. GIMC2001]WCL49145.1 hypothetical protein O4O04_17915 [Leptospira sp. GIMC2001]
MTNLKFCLGIIFILASLIAMLSCHTNVTRSSVPMKSWKILSDRSENPWAGFTNSWEEEEKSKIVQSAQPNSSYTGLIQSNEMLFENKPILYRSEKERKVIVDRRFFSDLVRVDATKLGSSEKIIIGQARDLGIMEPAFILRFLIRSQIIQTYIHTDSELEFIREEEKGMEKWYHFQGEHHYYTNSKNTGILKFIIILNFKTMEIATLGY